MKQPELLNEMLHRIVQGEEDVELVTKAAAIIKDLIKRDKVCKLNKVLYGLHQAGRQWNTKLHNIITSLRLKATNAHPCVYIKQ